MVSTTGTKTTAASTLSEDGALTNVRYMTKGANTVRGGEWGFERIRSKAPRSVLVKGLDVA
jgi:hypothetical protein